MATRCVKLNRFVRKPRLFRDESLSIAKSERKVILVFPSCDHRFKVWTGVPGLFQYQVYRALCIVCTEGYRASYRGRVFLVLEGPLLYKERGLDLPGGSQLNNPQAASESAPAQRREVAPPGHRPFTVRRKGSTPVEEWMLLAQFRRALVTWLYLTVRHERKRWS